MLIPLFLFERQLLPHPVFYLSAFLEQNREEYIARLRSLPQGPEAWQAWVEFFLRAIVQQASANVNTARGILALYEIMKQRVLELTRSQYAVPLLDALFERPILSISSFDGRPGLPSRQMLYRLLNQLLEAGILETLTESRGRKGQVFAFPQLLTICETGI